MRVLIGLVGRFEGDRGAAPAQPLQRDFLAVDQRHHDGAVFGGVAALDDHGVAIENAGLDHAVAGDFERVMLAAVAEQARRHADRVALVAQRLDRGAGGDAAVERQIDRRDIGRHRGAGQRGLEVAADHRRREAAAVGRRRRRTLLGQLGHLQRAGAVRQAADKAALLEAADQPMNAGFRFEVQRILHLVEGRRNAGCGQALVDEQQQFALLCGQHGAPTCAVRNKP